MLKFIIPVRHQQGVSDWSVIVRNLSTTLRSVASQTSPQWRCVVVASEGAQLPDVPQGCEVVRTDAPYKPLPPRDEDRDAYEAAIRADKGARVWTGLRHLDAGGFVMVVDYDDLVHRDLAAVVAADPANPSGWYVEQGYLYSEGGGILRKRSAFNTVCGTSNIVRDSILREAPAGEDMDTHI